MNIIFKPVFPCQRQPVLDSKNYLLRIKIEQSGINKLDHCVDMFELSKIHLNAGHA